MENTELIAFTCSKCGKEDTVPYNEIFIGIDGLWCRPCAKEYKKQKYEEFIAKNQADDYNLFPPDTWKLNPGEEE